MPQLTKNKQQNFIGIRVFDSRLYLDINEKNHFYLDIQGLSSVPNVYM
jgi:hypothetical protein